VIIELAIGTAAVAAVGSALAWFRRRRPPPPPALSSAAFEVESSLGQRGLRCGDVVTAPGLELALHAMIELEEEGLVLRAFRTLEVNERWLVQLDGRAKRLALGLPTTEVPAGAVPEVLPVGGRRVRVERRGRAIVRLEGPELQAMTRVEYVVMSERAGRVVVVIDPEEGARFALHLDELDIRGVDVLRGGDVPKS
jgi:hypothetical protein